MTPVIDSAQVLIAGGGISGITAAITPKKLGLDVILTERYGFLGGISTGGLLGTFCGFYTVKEDSSLFQLV
jgi:heterodisulfide reductase subunit A-like polyferredoxin